MNCTVQVPIFAGYEFQARSLLRVIESGGEPDLVALSQSLGPDFEHLLCDLFRLDDATVKHWVDGVTLDRAAMQPNRILVLTGRAWCADHREQREVPCEFSFRLSQDTQPRLESLTMRVGNAALRSLAGHRNRSITKTANPVEWLVEFDVESDKAAG